MKHALSHIHFIGVGGSGMSPLAEILCRQGYRVSGSDAADSAVTQRLRALGVAVSIGHDPAHVAGAQAVVASSAVRPDNAEVQAARAAGVPVVARAAMLAELMRTKLGVAVAGTHGKTTTTSLVAAAFVAAGADPTVVVGGELIAEGSNARLGAGAHVVVEADESDASFLHLNPVLAVVTNIDEDHMATYGHDASRLHDAFVQFVHRLPFWGRAVLCSDDAGVRAVRRRIERAVTTYGVDDDRADLHAVDVCARADARMRFVARQRGHADLPVELNLPGLHNVRNALAAIAAARTFGLPDASTAQALAGFAGVGRRFQRRGRFVAADGGAVDVVDDYGHHPVELAAVLDAARGAFPSRRLVLAFQPHRYTRTRDCFADFGRVLQRFDAVLLSDVYAAGESPIAGADGASLARTVPGAVFVPALDELPAAIRRAARGGDVVLVMGAGSIADVPAQLLEGDS